MIVQQKSKQGQLQENKAKTDLTVFFFFLSFGDFHVLLNPISIIKVIFLGQCCHIYLSLLHKWWLQLQWLLTLQGVSTRMSLAQCTAGVCLDIGQYQPKQQLSNCLHRWQSLVTVQSQIPASFWLVTKSDSGTFPCQETKKIWLLRYTVFIHIGKVGFYFVGR